MPLDLANAILGWLVSGVGGPSARGIRRVMLGDDRVRELRSIVHQAVDDTVAEVGDSLPADKRGHLRAVLREHQDSMLDERLADAAGLAEAIRLWVAAIDESHFDDGSAYLRDNNLDAEAVSRVLLGRVRGGLRENAVMAGALAPVEDWIWRDELREEILDGFSRSDARFDRLDAALDRLHRSGRPAAEPSAQALESARQSYLDWVCATHDRLVVHGLRSASGPVHVPLHRVYVALKVDTRSRTERVATAHRVRQEMEQRFRDADLAADQAEILRWYQATELTPPELFGWDGVVQRADQSRLMGIAELHGHDTVCVILGDPGSGKTTVMRWLASAHARALRAGRTLTSVPAIQVNSGADPSDPDVSLGPTRMPILLRITEFAEYNRHRRRRGDDPVSLAAFLGYHSWDESTPVWCRTVDGYQAGHSVPGDVLAEMLRRELNAGQVLVVLDGMDEVAPAERQHVTAAVTAFVAQYGAAGQPAGDTVNQILVTSRITGYYLAPLPAELTHVTIEKMSRDTVVHFVRRWMAEVLESRDPRSDRPDPGDAAAALLRELFRWEGRHALELATNPLFASVIVSLFLDGEGQLPPQPVELYQQAIDALVAVWSTRTGDRDDTERDRAWLFAVLPAVAAEIHAVRPDGLIGEHELTRLLRWELAVAREEDPDRPSPDTVARVAELLRLAREDIGILVESGPGAFKFSHLTFQEFLAAQHLIRDPELAGQRILAQLGDVRWQNAILMAIGLVNWSQPAHLDRVTGALLSTTGPLGRLYPETALLLATAFTQMVNVAADAVLATGERLMDSYLALAETGRLERIRRVIEAAFTELRRSGHARTVDRLWGRLLLDPPTAAHACRTAQLITSLDVVSTELAECLVRADRWDRAEFRYPIAAALTAMVSPQRLRRSTDRQDQDGTGPSRLGGDWLPTGIPMRRILTESPDLAARIVSRHEWLAVFIALYGGYADLDAGAALQEYRRIAAFLQLSDDDRRPYEIVYGQDWGYTETVIAMARYLDNVKDSYQQRWLAPPRFQVDAITRDSPLTPQIVLALRRDDPAMLVRLLRNQLKAADRRRRADAAIGLWALGLDAEISPDRDSAVNDEVRRRIGALRVVLRDAAVRAGNAAAPTLAATAATMSPDSWQRLLSATSAVSIGAGSDPIQFGELVDDLPEWARVPALAEELTHRVNGWGDDAIYSAAVFADSFHSGKYPVDLLVAALHRRGSSRHTGYSMYAFWWPADPLALTYADNDIPISVIDQVMRVPLRLAMFRLWAIRDVLAPRVAANPALRPELLSVAWVDLERGTNGEELVTLLDPDLLQADDPAGHIADRARRVDSPAHRVRALLRLAHAFADRRADLVAEALVGADQVTEPRQRFEVWERLATMTSGSVRQRCLDECHQTATRLPGADAARAWLRLARLQPRLDDGPLVERALSHLRDVDPAVRVELLTLISDRYADSAAAHAALKAYLSGQVGTEEADLASGLWGSVLAKHRPVLTGTGPDALQTWLPVELYARAGDLDRAAAAAEDRQIRAALAARLGPGQVVELLQRERDSTLRCSGPVVRAVDRALDGADAEQLVPVLGSLVLPDPDAEPVVQTWLEHPMPEVVQLAALILGEYRGLDPLVIGPAMELLPTTDNDLVRFRAARLVASNTQEPRVGVSTIGTTALDQVVGLASAVAFAEPGVALISRWMLDNLLHDDPAAVRSWCAATHADSDVALSVLRSINWATGPVWRVLLDELRTAPPDVGVALLDSVAVMVYRSSTPELDWHADTNSTRYPVDSTRWATIWPVLRELDPRRFPQRRVLASVPAVLKAAARALRDTDGGLLPDSVDRAQSYLVEAAGFSYADMLAGRDEVTIRAALYQAGWARIWRRQDQEAAEAEIEQLFNGETAEWPWAEMLARWIDVLLRESVRDTPPSWVRSAVLAAMVAAAAHTPNAFRGAADRLGLAERLAEVVVYHNGFPGRADAARLLGVLRSGSPATLDALRHALRDVFYVRHAAMNAIPRLRGVDQSLITDLIGTLEDESATTAWAAAQLLAAIGQSDGVSDSSRSQIIAALAAATSDARSHRTVHFSAVDAAIPEMPELDDAFAAALNRIYLGGRGITEHRSSG